MRVSHSFSISNDLLVRLKARADSERRSMSDLVNMLLENAIEANPSKQAPPPLNTAELDALRAIDMIVTRRGTPSKWAVLRHILNESGIYKTPLVRALRGLERKGVLQASTALDRELLAEDPNAVAVSAEFWMRKDDK